ncbi:MAG: NlpC/P60 family protein [Clostridium sp.]|nr:NlpC/P60 family protein [Acetatifactor muris]MCM1526352.1 NlpC/P60 family protein [Bacteroides sp.]MCM1563984.1 NlpC/P60 family protein [Clostridium sp.]
MKRRLQKLLSFLVVSALTVSVVKAGWDHSILAEATSIKDVQQNIETLTSQISQINQNIENMEEEQDILEEEMADLNAEIINTMTSIGMKEDEIVEKEMEIADKAAGIEETSVQYEEVKAQAEQQYDDMVVRLRKMYETGEESGLQLLLSGTGLSDLLNRMDYVEAVYEYDRSKLNEYEATQNYVLELWNQLEVEKLELEDAKAALEIDRENLEVQKAELNGMLDKKKAQSANYDAEIKKARQEANVAKKQLQQEQQELKRLQAAGKTSNAASGTYITDYNSIVDSASGSDLGKQVAKYALQYVGNPYVAGGTSLTNGADCSGFTYRVYSDFGYRLPRTSTEQRNAGTGVSYSEAQPGDLICYSGHVALYIGGGKIVHASTERTGIKVGNAEYKTILAVRRII